MINGTSRKNSSNAPTHAGALSSACASDLKLVEPEMSTDMNMATQELFNFFVIIPTRIAWLYKDIQKAANGANEINLSLQKAASSADHISDSIEKIKDQSRLVKNGNIDMIDVVKKIQTHIEQLEKTIANFKLEEDS